MKSSSKPVLMLVPAPTTDMNPDKVQELSHEIQIAKTLVDAIIAKGQPWTDPDFGPNASSFCCSDNPDGRGNYREYTWKRASQLYKNP